MKRKRLPVAQRAAEWAAEFGRAKAEQDKRRAKERQRMRRQPREYNQIDVEWAKILVCCAVAGYGLRIGGGKLRVVGWREADCKVNLASALATFGVGRELGLGTRILPTTAKAEACGVDADEAFEWGWLSPSPLFVDRRTTAGRRWIELGEILPAFKLKWDGEPTCPECGNRAGYGEPHKVGCSQPAHPWPTDEAYKRRLEIFREADDSYCPKLTTIAGWLEGLNGEKVELKRKAATA